MEHPMKEIEATKNAEEQTEPVSKKRRVLNKARKTRNKEKVWLSTLGTTK
jgi:hypothetical protein